METSRTWHTTKTKSRLVMNWASNLDWCRSDSDYRHQCLGKKSHAPHLDFASAPKHIEQALLLPWDNTTTPVASTGCAETGWQGQQPCWILCSWQRLIQNGHATIGRSRQSTNWSILSCIRGPSIGCNQTDFISAVARSSCAETGFTSLTGTATLLDII